MPKTTGVVMRSCLDRDGNLVPPKSLAAAVARRRRMAAEIVRIEHFVERRATGIAEILRAQCALETFQLEAEQLDAWIAAEVGKLLAEAHKLIKALERDGTDFTSDERQLIQRLDAYFAALREPIKPAKKPR